MIVDAHVHIFSPDAVVDRERLRRLDPYFAELYSSPKARMATAEDLVAAMDADGVDVAVAAGFGWRDHGLCHDHNAYLLDVVRRYAGRIVGLAIANPRGMGEAEKELDLALEAGLDGVGELMPDGPGYCIASPAVADSLAAVARAHSVPLMLHVSEPVGHRYPGKGSVSPGQVISFAERHPDVRVVCAHWGGGLPFYELMPEVRRALVNVYYDTAAWPLLYEDRIFSVAAQLVPGKVMFATDFPLLSQAEALARLRALGLDPEVERDCLAHAAERLYLRR